MVKVGAVVVKEVDANEHIFFKSNDQVPKELSP
jgi:hypothetical protein